MRRVFDSQGKAFSVVDSFGLVSCSNGGRCPLLSRVALTLPCLFLKSAPLGNLGIALNGPCSTHILALALTSLKAAWVETS